MNLVMKIVSKIQPLKSTTKIYHFNHEKKKDLIK